MRKIIIIVLMCVACRQAHKDLPAQSNSEEQSAETGQNTTRNHFETIAGGMKIDGASLTLDSVKQEWDLRLTVADDTSLIPKLDMSDAIDLHISHYYCCKYKKDSITGKWKMNLAMYRLNYESTSIVLPEERENSKDTLIFRFGNYCLSYDNWDGHNMWVCDYWKLEDFPWLKDRHGVKLDWNEYSTESEAMLVTAPPQAFEVYKRLVAFADKLEP